MNAVPGAGTAGRPRVVVVGGGPAGLMAAERASGSGAAVTVFDRMPSLGRKFLMAGRGGLNLTHTEPADAFLARYGAAAGRLRPVLAGFGPGDLRAWADGLGAATVVGSSGRVFPAGWKASPLLRAWLRRLAELGVVLHARHRWTGFADGHAVFATEAGARAVPFDALVLAAGGASWPRLGSDGRWLADLAGSGIAAEPLRPANMALEVRWSEPMARFEGVPLKRVALCFEGRRVPGEAVVTRFGLEGGAVYGLAGAVRDALDGAGDAVLRIDLRPDLSERDLAGRLGRARGRRSLSTFLGRAGLAPVAVALMREAQPVLPAEPAALAALAKAVPVRVSGTAGLDRAISSAGGVRWDELDESLMLRRLPGVFAAGEMIDWEAPTGGYLLQACFATGALAGAAAASCARARQAGQGATGVLAKP